MTTGTCLCGAVRYEIDGPFDTMVSCHCSMCRKHHGAAFATFVGAPFRMWHCHCSRCRRARSAAHASNVFYKFAQLRFLSGADRIAIYKVPEARLFGVAFCRRCGSEVPRAVREHDVAVVPGGSLDQDPGIRALAHIFVASRANWDDITDTTPQYAEVPPA